MSGTAEGVRHYGWAIAEVRRNVASNPRTLNLAKRVMKSLPADLSVAERDLVSGLLMLGMATEVLDGEGIIGVQAEAYAAAVALEECEGGPR